MKDKNVVMFVYNYFENDSRVLKEATSLAKNGNRVTLYALWKEGLEKKETINGFEVKRVTLNPLHKVFIKKSGASKIKKLIFPKKTNTPSKTDSKPTQKSISRNYKRKKLSKKQFLWSIINKFFVYKSFYNEIILDIKESNPEFDYIHAHDMNTLHLAHKLKKKYRKPFIYDSHELFIERDKQIVPPKWYKNLQRKFEKKRIKKANGVITVSNSIGHELVERYGIEYPVLIYNTPHYYEVGNQISVREKLNLPDSTKIIMYSGGFTIGRGLEVLIESIKYFPKNYHLVLLGFGNPEFVSMLNNIAKTEGIESQFSIYGPVASKEVPLYLGSADLCISPIQNVALNNYYSCPNKVFEYIQARVPMALSNFPELQRIIDEEQIGVTFDPSDSKNIAASVEKFLNDESAYKTAINNIELSAKKYNWENEEKKLLALYSKLN